MRNIYRVYIEFFIVANVSELLMWEVVDNKFWRLSFIFCRKNILETLAKSIILLKKLNFNFYLGENNWDVIFFISDSHTNRNTHKKTLTFVQGVKQYHKRTILLFLVL